MSEPSEQKRRSLPEWMRRRLDDQQRFLVLCILCGFICGLVGVGFHLAIHGLFDMVWDLARSQSFWGFIAIMLGAPTLGGLAVGIVVQKWAPQCAGSGIPQTITIDPNCSIRESSHREELPTSPGGQPENTRQNDRPPHAQRYFTPAKRLRWSDLVGHFFHDDSHSILRKDLDGISFRDEFARGHDLENFPLDLHFARRP